MAEPGEELLEGELGDGDYNELDADEEEALLADDDGYSDYNLPSVSSHRDVYISSPDSKAPRKIKVEDVEDVEEGDEILDNEEDDVLELGVDGNWNLDDLDSESQEQKRNPDSKPSLFQLWIKQERVDPSEFDQNEHVEDEDKHESSGCFKKSEFITSSDDISQSHLHDDDDEDYHERKDRFTSERSLPGVVSLKTPDSKWGSIPDSLDSVITPSQPKGAGQKSPRGGGAMGRRGGTDVRRGGGAFRGQQTGEAPHHKVLINPHFKGTSPAPPQSHQTPPGNAQQQAHHLNQSAHQYQKQPEYQQHQPPVNSQYPHYQEASAFAPHGGPPEQGAPYQNDWQNAPHQHQQQQQQQYEQHNYTGYYDEAPAHTPPTWNSPGQPAYQNYNQSPVGQPPPPASHPMLPPPATNTMQHILTQQQPPPPGLETEFTPRKVQFSDQNKLITVQMYPESAPGGGVGMRPPHQPPGAFVQQGRPRPPPPRPPFFAPQHHQPPFRPPPPFPPGQHPPQRMFPPTPHNQIPPRFLPRFRRGGFPRGGFPPPFRHPGGPRMMPPGAPFPPNASHPRLPNFRQQQPVKRPYPEPKNPAHQLPFKQKKPNPNSPEKPLIAGRKRNLLEVQTVDNVPDTTTFSDQAVEIEYDEDDDEETREYKRKIAEQKRLREKLLQEKEERRKLAAVAKQKELEQRKVTSQNAPNPQAAVAKPQRPTYIESSQHQQQQHHQQQQQQHQQQQPSRVSVHQRIGTKPSPVRQPQSQPQPSHALPQVTFFNDQQPAAFRMVRVRTKDGTVLIKKLPINSAGQVMLQRAAVAPTHAHAPPHMEHHQPEQQQLMMPPPQHHQPPPPAQHQQFYPQQVVAPQPLPYPSPATLQLQQLNQYQYHQPQANPPQPVYHPPPQPVQQPFYQHQPPQTMQIHNPVSAVNSKRIVLDQPQTGTPKSNFQNRSKAKLLGKKLNVNNHSSVITIVPVDNKTMTLGQRFTMQNKQVKSVQKSTQQQPKIPVQAPSLAKPNRTVINPGLKAGSSSFKTPLPPGPVTNKVVVDNLTAGTSRQQLVSMAEQVGEVKILTLDTSQKRASITFNNTAAASAFYQKFQRKMVNLSMINVSFVNE